MLFTLQYGLQVMGNDSMKVRVCARPGRDAAHPHNGNQIALRSSPNDSRPMKKPEKSRKRRIQTELSSIEDPRDDEVYEIQLRGRNLYKIVMTIIRNYEMAQQNYINPNQSEASTSSRRNRPLTGDTAIKTWLNDLGLGQYVDRFAECGLYVLDDLHGRFNRTWLLSLDIHPTHAERIQSSYASWFNVIEASRMSSVESIPEDRSGIRFSRTKVTHSYQISQ